MTHRSERSAGTQPFRSRRDCGRRSPGTAPSQPGGVRSLNDSVKILITGSTGLLGQALVKRLAPSGEVVGLSRRSATSQGRARHVVCDLTDAEATRQAVRETAPDVVIHTQALSDVDRCEQEPREAERMNVQTMEHLCRALEEGEPLLLALSTDYVFDGVKGRPYDEQDEPKPLSVYGRTKLAGEQRALRYAKGYVIRPSTLFGVGRMNFCDAIVQHVQRGEPIEAFVDQTTSPTYSDDLAEGIDALIHAMAGASLQDLPRLYHVTNAGWATRVEFAKRVAALLKQDDSLIQAVPMHHQHRPAPRPPYSALVSRHLAHVIGRTLRPWDEALQAYLRQRHPFDSPTHRRS